MYSTIISFASALLIALGGHRVPLVAGEAVPGDGAAPVCHVSSVTPTSAIVPAAGGTGSVTVTAEPPDCTWTASSFDSFVTITSGASGTGNGTVEYSVSPNPYATTRVATHVTVAFTNVLINQHGTCSYALSVPSVVSVPISGATGAVTVTTGPQCSWRATSGNATAFVQFAASASGPWSWSAAATGSGTFWYSAPPNARGRRMVGVGIFDGLDPFDYPLAQAWRVFTVQQAGKAVGSDFTGDGTSDPAVFRPASGTWIVQGAADAQLGQAGDIPVPGDYDGDLIVDRAVFRPSDATWRIGTAAPIPFGQTGDLPVPADYDGDAVTDMAVFRTFTGIGQWYIRGQGGPFVLGQRGDVPVPEDYDSDGKTDLAVFRPGNGIWYITTAASGFTVVSTMQFGLGGYGDVPVPGDFDGDGALDFAVYRPGIYTLWWKSSKYHSTYPHTLLRSQFCCGVPAAYLPVALDTNGDGVDEFALVGGPWGWLMLDRLSEFWPKAYLGGPGDIPAAARPRLPHVNPTDVDADGASDMAVFTPSTGTWRTRVSRSGYAPGPSHTLGQSGDVKVPGDYDGDRRADYAVWRPADGTWHLDFSTFTAPRTIQWGLPGDTPVPADYDGDGRTDLAVWRPSDGIWYILDSSSDFQTPRLIQWGLGYWNDVPVPGDFDGDGKADLAVYRPEPGLWYLKLSSGSDVVKQWGLGYYNDVPLVGDFDGDGRAELTVYRPAYGLWYSMDPLTGVALPVRQFGLPGDVPLIADFDADGITDLTVYRPSGNFWFTQRSTLGFYGPVQWGQSGDEPLLRIR